MASLDEMFLSSYSHKNAKGIPLPGGARKRLLRLAKTAPTAKQRYDAAWLLNDEAVWQEMLLNDPENFSFALNYCEDFHFLKEQYLRQADTRKKKQYLDKFGRMAENRARDYIKACGDDAVLFQIALSSNVPIAENEFMQNDTREYVKAWAIDKMNEPGLLAELAVRLNDRNLTQLAVKRINRCETEALTRVALEAKESFCASDALDKINDISSLELIARQSDDPYLRKRAQLRFIHEDCRSKCSGEHSWEPLRSEFEDDGDSPRFDWIYEKCSRCGMIMRSTFISSKPSSTEYYYEIDGKEVKI